jgi:hypothetical protein
VDGVPGLLVEWAERSGLNQTTISARINRGWTALDAVTLPLKS